MKRTTKKLSGVGLELFLRRFYASYNDIDDALAKTLARDGRQTFASARVRQMAWRSWRGRRIGGDQLTQPVAPESSTQDAIIDDAAMAAVSDVAPAAPSPGEAEAMTPAPRPDATDHAAAEPAAPDTAPFDPYAIGLIPTYQREGAEGLLAKLADISTPEHLRKMARSQQVALPAELRGPDADIAAMRSAIVEAVGKRIANRRAAAG